MMPAAVNHTEMKMDTSWARRIELDVFRMLRYWRMSGTVISRRARRNLSPIHVRSRYIDTKDGGIVK